MVRTPSTGRGTAGGGAAPDDSARSVAGKEADDLRASLTALSRLSTGALGLQDLLMQAAIFAVRAIPRADGAGLTMIEPERSDIVVGSAPFVTDIDAIQYTIGEGPCVSAVRERATMRSGSLGTDPRWPRFGPRAESLGTDPRWPRFGPRAGGPGCTAWRRCRWRHRTAFSVRSNVYAHANDAFDDEAIELGGLFAAPEAIVVQNAQQLATAKRVAADLQSALSHRAVIDQAVGIVMSRAGCTADEAFHQLRQLSQTRNTKLSVVAQSLVGEAVRRARTRRTGG